MREPKTRRGLPAAPNAWRPSRDTLVGGGRYRLARLLGRGGMGEVWEAEQLPVGRRVALKILVDHTEESVAIRRFVRETHSLRGLEHPNVVPVIDAGWVEGRPFLVMPLLEGRDLADELTARGTFPLDEVIALLEGPAAALDAIHAAGRVHRDIKPENLFVSRGEGGAPLVRVLDFGLTVDADAARAKITRDGVVAGTPEYISPEGAMGRRPDARGDVYSLAVVAFELLTGRLPFEEEKAFAMLVAKAHHEPPSLAERGLLAGPRLEAAFAQGLARVPDDRFARASAFLNALRAALVEGTPALGIVDAETEPAIPLTRVTARDDAATLVDQPAIRANIPPRPARVMEAIRPTAPEAPPPPLPRARWVVPALIVGATLALAAAAAAALGT